jgi:hypothetical protein
VLPSAVLWLCRYCTKLFFYLNIKCATHALQFNELPRYYSIDKRLILPLALQAFLAA